MSAPTDPPAAQAGRVATQSAVLHWLEALAAGSCDQRTFLSRIDPMLRGSGDAAWELLALLDQYYRRGKIPASQFQVLKSHIQRLALGAGDTDGAMQSRAAVEAPRAASTTAPVGASPAPDPAGASSLVPVPAVAAADPRHAAARAAGLERERMPGPGDVLRGRYRIVGVLGQGGMGTVFDAIDLERVDLPAAGQHLAVKVLHTTVMQRPALFAELRSEFQHLQTLSHPNIVRVHEFDRDGDTAFFTMELLRGSPLDQMLAKIADGMHDRELAVGIIHDVGAALAHAHACGIVHGDINPSNIFITRDLSVRVLDFGASHKLKRGPWIAEFESHMPPPVATPGYASCQVLEGEVAEARDDVFGLACIIYLLLTGTHPFQRRTALEARAHPVRLVRPAGLSRRQWRVLQQGLHFEREGRPNAIGDWLASLGLEAPSSRGPRSSSPAAFGVARSQWIIAGTCAIAAVVVFAALAAKRNADLRLGGASSGGMAATGAATQAPADAASEADASSEAPPAQAVIAAPPPVPAAAQTIVPPAATVAPTTTTSAALPLATATAASPPPPAPTPASTPAAASASSAPASRARVELTAAVVTVLTTAPMALVPVRRKGSMRGDASFRWWTESGTAKAGADFAAIAPRVEHIADRKSGVNLAVPVISDPTRRQSRSFFVLIDSADPGTAVVTRTTTLVAIEQPP